MAGASAPERLVAGAHHDPATAIAPIFTDQLVLIEAFDNGMGASDSVGHASEMGKDLHDGKALDAPTRCARAPPRSPAVNTALIYDICAGD